MWRDPEDMDAQPCAATSSGRLTVPPLRTARALGSHGHRQPTGGSFYPELAWTSCHNWTPSFVKSFH